jgi:hypothetical protein
MEDIVLSIPTTFALIFLLGFLGYRIFDFLHIPGGAITGALVMVALVTSQGAGWAELPSYVCTCYQVVLGIVLGCKFSKEKVPAIKSLFIPGLFSAAWMICISLAVGLLLAKVTEIDLGTALFGSVPGGLSEMGLIALSFNLSVPVVTLFQFVRVITVILSVPLIASKYNHSDREEAAANILPKVDKAEDNKAKGFGILTTLVIGGIGGFTAKHLGVPVGGMLGAMIVVATLRIAGVPIKEVPRWVIIPAQIGLGGYLGTTFTPDIVVTLQGLLLPTLVFSLVIVLSGIALAFLNHRIYGWDITTSLLASAAAGFTQMCAIALDMDADVVTVSIIQALRIAIILTLMPLLITLIIV